MSRFGTLFLLALVISACTGAPPQRLEPVATQAMSEEIAQFTNTALAPAANPQSTGRSTPSPKATYTRTATPIAIVTRTATQTAIYTTRSTPTSIPTVDPSTRSKDGMTMVYVAAGDFPMGNPLGFGSDEEAPQHNITLDGFWIDRTEVTNAQYHAFVAATGHQKPLSCGRGDATYDDAGKKNHPVVCVSWNDAQAYCKWVGARLPTEAEWEKAARGTDCRVYPWGNSFDGSLLNYCDANCDSDQKDTRTNDGYAQTAPVGSYPLGVSPYGALDMAGNVMEWVSDWYSFYYYAKSPQHNPQGPGIGEYRVLRGGSWFGTSSNARTAFRAWLPNDMTDSAIGFRCVVVDR